MDLDDLLDEVENKPKVTVEQKEAVVKEKIIVATEDDWGEEEYEAPEPKVK